MLCVPPAGAVSNEPSSLCTDSPPSSHRSRTPLLPPACGTLRIIFARSYVRAEGAHLVFYITVFHSVISWNFFLSFFFFFFFFQIVAHFLPTTFTYDSQTWGQVMVSLGETSLFCCCCWAVRFSISAIAFC